MTRLRWALLGVAAVVVIASVALYALDANLTLSSETDRRTWVVQPGETLTLSADEVGPDDLYRCPGKGGVNGTPDRGTGVGGSGGFSVETADDGTVTAYCEPGPPGNV
jgi:hypothetical protein